MSLAVLLLVAYAFQARLYHRCRCASVVVAVVALDRTVWTEAQRPVEWAHIVAVAALYTFTYEYDILEWTKPQKQEIRKEVGT